VGEGQFEQIRKKGEANTDGLQKTPVDRLRREGGEKAARIQKKRGEEKGRPRKIKRAEKGIPCPGEARESYFDQLRRGIKNTTAAKGKKKEGAAQNVGREKGVLGSLKGRERGKLEVR